MKRTIKTHETELKRIDKRIKEIDKVVKENKRYYGKQITLIGFSKYHITMSISLKKERRLLRNRRAELDKILISYKS